MSLNVTTLSERSQIKKKLHAVWFHLYNILENANLVTESMSVIAWGKNRELGEKKWGKN